MNVGRVSWPRGPRVKAGSGKTERAGVEGGHLIWQGLGRKQVLLKEVRGSSEITTDLYFFFWPRYVASGILVPQPGIKPVPPAMRAWRINHWTTREVPTDLYFKRVVQSSTQSNFLQ